MSELLQLTPPCRRVGPFRQPFKQISSKIIDRPATAAPRRSSPYVKRKKTLDKTRASTAMGVRPKFSVPDDLLSESDLTNVEQMCHSPHNPLLSPRSCLSPKSFSCPVFDEVGVEKLLKILGDSISVIAMPPSEVHDYILSIFRKIEASNPNPLINEAFSTIISVISLIFNRFSLSEQSLKVKFDRELHRLKEHSQHELNSIRQSSTSRIDKLQKKIKILSLDAHNNCKIADQEAQRSKDQGREFKERYIEWDNSWRVKQSEIKHLQSTVDNLRNLISSTEVRLSTITKELHFRDKELTEALSSINTLQESNSCLEKRCSQLIQEATLLSDENNLLTTQINNVQNRRMHAKSTPIQEQSNNSKVSKSKLTAIANAVIIPRPGFEPAKQFPLTDANANEVLAMVAKVVTELRTELQQCEETVSTLSNLHELKFTVSLPSHLTPLGSAVIPLGRETDLFVPPPLRVRQQPVVPILLMNIKHLHEILREIFTKIFNSQTTPPIKSDVVLFTKHLNVFLKERFGGDYATEMAYSLLECCLRLPDDPLSQLYVMMMNRRMSGWILCEVERGVYKLLNEVDRRSTQRDRSGRLTLPISRWSPLVEETLFWASYDQRVRIKYHGLPRPGSSAQQNIDGTVLYSISEMGESTCVSAIRSAVIERIFSFRNCLEIEIASHSKKSFASGDQQSQPYYITEAQLTSAVFSAFKKCECREHFKLSVDEIRVIAMDFSQKILSIVEQNHCYYKKESLKSTDDVHQQWQFGYHNSDSEFIIPTIPEIIEDTELDEFSLERLAARRDSLPNLSSVLFKKQNGTVPPRATNLRLFTCHMLSDKELHKKISELAIEPESNLLPASPSTLPKTTSTRNKPTTVGASNKRFQTLGKAVVALKFATATAGSKLPTQHDTHFIIIASRCLPVVGLLEGAAL